MLITFFQRPHSSAGAVQIINKPLLTVAPSQQITPSFLEPQQQYVAAIPVQPVLATAGFPGTAVVTSMPTPDVGVSNFVSLKVTAQNEMLCKSIFSHTLKNGWQAVGLGNFLQTIQASMADFTMNHCLCKNVFILANHYFRNLNYVDFLPQKSRYQESTGSPSTRL